MIIFLISCGFALIFNFAQLRNVSAYGIDTSLGDVDASFTGENDGNSSVTEVSVIGDVNNDGFDDILISMHWNHQNGYYAGKTCLIFGKKNDWKFTQKCFRSTS